MARASGTSTGRGRMKANTGERMPISSSGADEVGDQEVLAHVGDQQLLPERVDR